MKLEEWFLNNSDKEVEFKDGKLFFKEEKKPKTWKPEKGDRYFSLDKEGGVYEDAWSDHSIDTLRYEVGNVFKSEEDVKTASKRLRFRKKLEEAGAKFEYRYFVSSPYIDLEVKRQDGKEVDAGFWFENTENKELALRTLGEDNIRDFVLGRPLEGWEEE